MKTRPARAWRRLRRRTAGCAIRRRCCWPLARVSLVNSSWRRQDRPGSSGHGRWEVVARRHGLVRLRRTSRLGLARAARLAQVVARQDDSDGNGWVCSSGVGPSFGIHHHHFLLLFDGCGAIFMYFINFFSQHYYYDIDSIQFGRSLHYYPRVTEYVCYLLVVYKSYSPRGSRSAVPFECFG